MPSEGIPVLANPLPTVDNDANSKLTSVINKLSGDPATQTTLAAVLSKISADPATQTTLAAILAKLISAPSTEAKQTDIINKLSGDPATSTKQDTGNSTLSTLNGKVVNSTITVAALTMNEVSQNLNIVGGKLAIITARGGGIYLNINGSAVIGSGGYVPEESSKIIYLSGLSSLAVIGPTGSYCHYEVHT